MNMKTKRPSVEEAKIAYKKIHDEDTTDENLNKLIDEFMHYRSFADKIDMSIHKCIVIDPKTIEEHIVHNKRQQQQEEAMEEYRQKYRQKLESLNGTERFLFEEGFYDDLGQKVQSFLDHCPEGKDVYENIRMSNGTPSCQEVTFLLDSLCRYVDEEWDKSKIKDFVIENDNKLSGWFDGIFQDGQRALRTIHVISRMFHEYCTGKKNPYDIHNVMSELDIV